MLGYTWTAPCIFAPVLPPVISVFLCGFARLFSSKQSNTSAARSPTLAGRLLSNVRKICLRAWMPVHRITLYYCLAGLCPIKRIHAICIALYLSKETPTPVPPRLWVPKTRCCNQLGNSVFAPRARLLPSHWVFQPVRMNGQQA